MESQDNFERWKLGYTILRMAAEVVLDDIEPHYQHARETGQIDPTKQPRRALRFLMKHFDNRQPEYDRSIANALAAA